VAQRLVFNAFAMNTASHIVHGQWRSPETQQRDFDDLDVWVDVARLLERGRFDALFLADVVGVYNDYRGGWEKYAEAGMQIPSNDPSVLISALAYNTEHLGFAISSSTIQAPPFELARRMSTLDHLTKGRVAWNVVTSSLANGHRNFGFDGLIDHDERYRRAYEYLEVTYKLWEGSWEDDALLKDAEGNRFSDPAKIHKIHHEGEFWRVEGPHLPSPSPQRTPVLYQAGSSTAGREFAARNAEAVFLIAASPEGARGVVEATGRIATAHGRRPEDVHFVQGLSFVVGSTEEEARRKNEVVEEYMDLDAQLAHMSGAMNVDLGDADLDEPIAHLADRVQGVQSVVESVIAAAPEGSVPTVADLARRNASTTRIVGTPEQIADRLETWQAAGITGVNVMYNTLPGTFAEFVEHVTPELQRRGLQQSEYREGTLREKLFDGGDPHLPDRHPARAYRRR
jgi:long-chain alkane monooxygenase